MRWHRISGLLLKYYYITKHSLDRILDLIYWPIFVLLVWGFTSKYVNQGSSINYVAIFIGGFALWFMAQRAAQDMSVYVLEDFWNSNLLNIFSSPLQAIELAISTAILGLIR